MTGASEDRQRELEEFLDKATDEQAARQEGERRRVEGPERFKEIFAAVRASKIAPVLGKACEPWQRRGLPAEVDVDDVSWEPSLSLIVEPHPHLRAELVYRARTDSRDILAFRDFGPGAGESLGTFGLNDITRELVQKHVDDFMAEVVRLGSPL